MRRHQTARYSLVFLASVLVGFRLDATPSLLRAHLLPLIELGGGKDGDEHFLLMIPPSRANVSSLPRQRLLKAVGGENASARIVQALGGCLLTSRVEIYQEQNGSASDWILKSLDEKGQPKSAGGDEYYITWKDNAWKRSENGTASNDESPIPQRVVTAVAKTTDLWDGTYRLQFFAPPLTPKERYNESQMAGQGELTIHLQYSCGVGNMPRPTKQDWVTGGSLSVTWKAQEVPSPPIHQLELPPPFGLSRYEHIVALGDSIMGLFVGQYRGNPNFVKSGFPLVVQGHPDPRQTHYAGNIRMPLNNKTFPEAMQKLGEWHGSKISALSSTNASASSGTNHSAAANGVAILVGSSSWDMIWSDVENDPNFDEHIDTVRNFILAIEKKYPNVDVLWKSPTAVHIHTLAMDNKLAYTPSRYSSTNRTMILYERQKELMNELQVPFLDTYWQSYFSREWLFPGDFSHYRPEFDAAMTRRFWADSAANSS